MLALALGGVGAHAAPAAVGAGTHGSPIDSLDPAVTAAALPAADTVVRVAAGTPVELREIAGEVIVEGWDRDEVRVQDVEGGRGFRVSSGGDRTTLRPRVAGDGRDREGSYRLWLPATSPLLLRGGELDIEVRGLRAGAEIRNLEGTIELVSLRGSLTVRSVDGEIRGRSLEGELEIRTVDESIRLRDVRGRLEARTTDGDLVIEDAALDVLEASATDGDLTFSGEIRPGGRYALLTHSGDVEVVVPPGTNAEVVVSTFDGGFEADFPVMLERMQTAGEARFTLGDGGATMVLEAFDGEIRLRRGR